MDHLFLKLAAAFICGVTLFVIIITLRNRKNVSERRKTTSIRMAKVVSETIDEKSGELPPNVRVIPKDAAEPEPVITDDAASVDGVDAADTADAEEVSADESADPAVDGDNTDSEDAADDTADDAADDAADETPQSVQEDAEAETDVDDDVDDDADGNVGDKSENADKPIPEDSTAASEDAESPALNADVPFDAKPLALDSAIESDDVGAASCRPSSDEAKKDTHAPPRIRPRKPETVNMKERKVLLVEDAEMNRELIKMFFDGTTVKLDFAENGRVACDKFAEAPGNYSLILMDIRMPVMDGFEAAKTIRDMDIDWAKQIPIIAMTGEAHNDDIDQCFDAGMDDHISKPVNMELLQEKVFEFISMNAE